MPYSGPDDPDLPEHVRQMPERKRSAWVKIFNNAYHRCIEKHGDDCDGSAMRIANAMVKRIQMEGGRMFYADLSQLIEGKWFDGMAAGTFVSMSGREVTFKPSELAEYVKNTKAAIEATRTESGEIVGLPIDAKGHENGDGAGWIVDVKLEDGKVRLLARWTEIGQELISKGIRRFFSPTVDVENKVIIGGSLTNWPATRDKKQRIMLRPVEMSADLLAFQTAPDLLELADDQEPLDEYVDDVRISFYEAMRAIYPNDDINAIPWVARVFADFIIVRKGLDYYRVEYHEDDEGNYVFADERNWRLVKRQETWIEAALDGFLDYVKRLVRLQNRDNDKAPEAIFKIAGKKRPVEQSISDQEVLKMEITKEELVALIKDVIQETTASGTKAVQQTEGEAGKPSFDVLSFLEMDNVNEEVKDAFRQAMLELHEKAKKEAALEAAQMIQKIRREAHVTEFASKLTGGTDDNPRGIAVEADKLSEFILSLDPDQAAFIQPLLEKLWRGEGIVEFEEAGHQRKMVGTVPLPEDIARRLASGELKISDLSDPILGLGDIKQYDLSAFRKESER